MSGCPEVLPSVFSVGPGPRITYGTGSSTATTIATTVARPAMASVRERRDMFGRLRAADPFVGTVAEPLVLPDRHRRLELVDQRVAGGEGLGPGRPGSPGRGGGLGREGFGRPPQLVGGRRVGRVGEPGHPPVGVMVAD